MSLIQSVAIFLWEWMAFAFTAGTFVGKIVGPALYLIGFFVAATDKTSLSVTFLTNNEGKENMETLQWPVPLGWTIFMAVFVVWLAIAGGVTWARHIRLEIGKEPQHLPLDNSYVLEIKNHGVVETEIPVFAEYVADENGYLDEANARLPAELPWMNESEEARPKLARGRRRKVHIVHISGGRAGGEKDDWESNVVLLGSGICIGTVSPKKKKLWLAVSVHRHDCIVWFSVEAGSSRADCKVIAEKPPFLRDQISWPRRYVARFRALLMRLFNGRP